MSKRSSTQAQLPFASSSSAKRARTSELPFHWGEELTAGGAPSLLHFHQEQAGSPNLATLPLAMFDLDSTITKTRSGATFPKDANDWEFCFQQATMLARFQHYHDQGYRLVILSNQKGVESNKQTVAQVKNRVEQVCTATGLPWIGLFACASDVRRKPGPGMLDFILSRWCGGATAPAAGSFYCGDGAGRLKDWNGPKTKKDFSDSDRAFAANCGLPFHSPEALFLKEKETTKWAWSSFDPSPLLQAEQPSYDAAQLMPPAPPAGKQQLVIFCGPQGGGKSSIVQQVYAPRGWHVANFDDTKSDVKKLMKAAAEAVAAGKSVVVDKTNVNREKRAPWLAFAMEHGLESWAVFLSLPKRVAWHQNVVRGWMGGAAVKEVVLHTWYKHLEEPTEKEGFKGVLKPAPALVFLSDTHRRLYKCRTTSNIKE